MAIERRITATAAGARRWHAVMSGMRDFVSRPMGRQRTSCHRFANGSIHCIALGLLFAVSFASAATDKSGSPTAAAASADEPRWWQLVQVQIDEAAAPGAQKTPNAFSTHPLDLLIPAGWELHGQVDWPQHKGSPSLAFQVNSPDGRIGLEYLPRESSSWSEDAGTRTSLQALGVKVEPLPPTRAADYLQRVLLPKLRPDARVISIERLPEIAGYLDEQLAGLNRVAQYGAGRNGLAAPKSSGDAARARITYLRDGAPVEEWLEIAVEHLQRREDRNPWKPGETARVYVDPDGPMIDTFTVVECVILRAPQGALELNGRILASILGTLSQNELWDSQASYEYWHGKFTDRVIFFRRSYFGKNPFEFTGPSPREYHYFAYRYAWTNEGDAEFIVTDSADFDPNRKIGTQNWQRLQPEAAH